MKALLASIWYSEMILSTSATLFKTWIRGGSSSASEGFIYSKFHYKTGTAEGEGLVGPRPHHFFAPPPPLFALKRKKIKIKKRLETSFFPSIFRCILCIFFNFKREAFCGALVLFAVIVPLGRLAPWSNAMPWPPLRFLRQRVLYFQLRESFFNQFYQTKWRKLLAFSSQTKVSSCFELIKVLYFVFRINEIFDGKKNYITWTVNGHS